jgi:hypothetical protein
MEEPKQLFAPVGAQVDEPKLVEEIESLCMNCHEDVSGFFCSVGCHELQRLLKFIC